MTQAYSYIRFSTPEQSKGDSLRRQTEATTRYCEQHDLCLDTDLSFKDLGKSGYRGRNIKDGALGEFLEAVREGLVPQGSVLLVENMDRISRMKPRKALRVLEDIVESGVDVVTLNDGRRYNDENLDNLDSLLISLLAFSLANEESAKKAVRVRAAWANKRNTIAPGMVNTHRTKAWLTVTDGKLTLVPDRAKVVQGIFKSYLAGRGLGSIAADMNSRGVSTGTKSKFWRETRIARLLDDPAVCGTLTLCETSHVEGRRVLTAVDKVEGYYPRIVSDGDYARVQVMRSQKSTMTGRHRVMTNVFSGLLRCSRCGAGIVRTTKSTGRAPKRTVYPVLVCSCARRKGACKYESIKYDTVSSMFLGDLQRLCADAPLGDDGEVVDAKIDGLENSIDDAGQRLEALLDLAEAGKSVGGRIRKLEQLLGTLRGEHEGLLNERTQLSNAVVVARCRQLLTAAKAGDVPGMNRSMRQLCSSVTLDWDDKVLRFEFRHGATDEVSIAPIVMG